MSESESRSEYRDRRPLWDVTKRNGVIHAELYGTSTASEGMLLSAHFTQDEAWNAAKILAKAHRGRAVLHARDYKVLDEVSYSAKAEPRGEAATQEKE